MKKILSYSLLIGGLALISMSSCKKLIDEAYANPNAKVRVPIETLLPGIIGNMIGSSSAQGSGYGTGNDALYVGRYIQYWATNVTGNQFDQMGGATGVSDLLGNVWAMHYYGQGENLNKMILWGKEEKKWDYVGVGYAIRAWGWLSLTNMHGEVIMKEAFRPEQLVFKYDDQEFVYDSMRVICRLALEYLNMDGDSVSQANLNKGDAYLNKGDRAKWKKFVYAVLARSFNQLSNKSTYKPDSVIHYCNLAMQTNADNVTATFANTGITGTSNFFGPFRANMGALRQTEWVTNLMNGLNPMFAGVVDPRIHYYLRDNPNGTYKGIKPNRGASGLATADQPKNFWGGLYAATTATLDTGARYIFKNGAPFPIITASEIQFMKAEAYYRKGDRTNALNAYRQGISLSLDLLTTDYNASVPTALQMTPAAKTAFLTNTKVVPATGDSLRMTHIMLQKYLALFGYGAIETWTDMRRFHYTDFEESGDRQVYVDFLPPSGTDLFTNNNLKWVYRARPRYNSEYLYNIAELQRLGGLDLDYHTKEQWFSQK